MAATSTSTTFERVAASGELRTTLLHPVFWSALALLLLNDHVLKGAGLVPAALTGKLSDFAGLIVAPWLAVAVLGVLGARSRRARMVAFGLVVLPFALTKGSPLLAATLDAIMSALGLAWRTWSDPTDLVALAVLPLSWNLSTPRAERSARAGARALERTGLVLGAAACLATSNIPGPPTVTTTAWLLNRTGAPITVHARWSEAAIDCEAIGGRGVRAATREALGEHRTFLVPPNAGLGLANTFGAAGADASACQVVLLQADGLVDTVVAWSSLPWRSMPATFAVGDDGDAVGRVTLEARGGEIVAVAGIDVEVGAFAEVEPPSSCSGLGGEIAEWSPSGVTGGTHRLDAIDVGPDGCLGLQLTSESDASTRTLFLCVPGSAVPFVAGARIAIQESADPTTTGRTLQIAELDGDPWARSALSVFADVERLEYRELRASIDPLDCDGERRECGALVLPALSTATHPGVRATLRTGEAMRIDGPVGDLGARTELLFMRGERVIFAPIPCEADLAEPRVRGDFVLTAYGSPVPP